MSTPAEQIATLSRVINLLYPKEFKELVDIKATLEGLAAPGTEAPKRFGTPAPRSFDKETPGPGWKISEETQRELEAMETGRRYVPGDSPSPQQPTQEALSEALDYLDFPEVPWDKIKDALLPETRNQIIALATLLDRFAAQRGTAIEAQLATVREGAQALIKQAVRERDAATDKARRETIGECEQVMKECGHNDPVLVKAIRALTQNPGDAARDENA